MRAGSLLLWWGGAALALLAANQDWWVMAGAAGRGISGATATTGAAVALPLAALAGALLSAWLRGAGRRVLPVLTAALLLGAIVVGLTADPDGSLPASGLLADGAPQPQAWLWIYPVVAGLGAGGAVLQLFVPPAAPRTTSGAAADASLDAWRRLDAGEDPT
ncbi:MAG: Trp biosynthesis-associated membrane protein [Micropruina sp.]|nr:Trp biosynthesis-associated membrane protein [Micropruina sp.]